MRPLADQPQPRPHHCSANRLPRVTRAAVRRRPAPCIIQRTAGYGPVCPVVWEGRSRKAPPYPDQRGVAADEAGLTPFAGRRSHWPASLLNLALGEGRQVDRMLDAERLRDVERQYGFGYPPSFWAGVDELVAL